jgi:cobalt-zinc-cadmium efflux system membrane fusion protein
MKKTILIITLVVMLAVGCKKQKTETKQEMPSPNDSAIAMSTSAQQNTGMVVGIAAETQMKEYLHVTGSVQPVDSRVASVRPISRGRIVEVRVRVGDHVEAGQTLATFDNLEAADLRAQLQAALSVQEELRARLVPAQHQAERSRRLADIGAVAEREAESAHAEKTQLESNLKAQYSLAESIRVRMRRLGLSTAASQSSNITFLKAPFSGVVTKAQVSSGDLIDELREVFAIADLSHLWVQAEVYEKDLGRIRLGQDAIIHVDTYPQESFKGRVSYISDMLDPQTRTARVRCEVTNTDGRLKTEMFASVELPSILDKKAITIATSAIQKVDGKAVVFLRRGPTHFEKREVETGVTLNGQVEIVRGLAVGDQVVTQGAFHLKSILAGNELGVE